MSAFVAPTALPLAPSARLSPVCPWSGSALSLARAAGAAPAHLVAPLRMQMDMDDAPMREPEQAPMEEAKLFVGNLAWETTNESLSAAFAEYGTVVDSRVVKDRFSGKSRGFGFIQYEDPSSAEEALVGMNGVLVDGRNVRVDRANTRPPRQRRPRQDYNDNNSNYY